MNRNQYHNDEWHIAGWNYVELVEWQSDAKFRQEGPRQPKPNYPLALQLAKQAEADEAERQRQEREAPKQQGLF